MSEFVDMIQSEQDEGWKVTDDRAADWAVRKIREVRQDTERWKAYYQQQLEKITSSNLATECFFAARLQEYFETVPHHDTDTQSKYKLPSGDLIVKKRDPEYKVVDQKKATEWLAANGMGEYVEAKYSVKWSALKKTVTTIGDAVFDKDGEQVPGIQVTPRDPEFTVSTK